MKRQLAHFRAKHVTSHAQKIAPVEIGPIAEGALSHLLLAHVELQFAGAIGKVGEARLSHRSLREHAAGNTPAFGACVLARDEKPVTLEQFGGRGLHLETALRERIVPPRTQSGQILTSGRHERRFGPSEFVQ